MNKQRNVVVTGALGGMGALVVERFPADGDTVVATDTQAAALGRLTSGHPADARLHTIVAGYLPTQSFAETAAADFRKVVDIDLAGVLPMIKAIQPLMRGRGRGRIVTIAVNVDGGKQML